MTRERCLCMANRDQPVKDCPFCDGGGIIELPDHRYVDFGDVPTEDSKEEKTEEE